MCPDKRRLVGEYLARMRPLRGVRPVRLDAAPASERIIFS
jgi:hypothetical protein